MSSTITNLRRKTLPSYIDHYFKGWQKLQELCSFDDFYDITGHMDHLCYHKVHQMDKK